MSYTPTNWQNGDVITAEKLNKLENGVASSSGGEVFTVTFTEVENSGGGAFTCNKTATQAKAAYDAGQKIVGVINGVLDYTGVPLDGYDAGDSNGVPYLYFKGWGPVYSNDGISFNAFKFYRLVIYDSQGETSVEVNMASVN